MDGFNNRYGQGKNDNQGQKGIFEAEKCNRPENVEAKLDKKPFPGGGHFFGPELRQRDAH